MLHWPAYLIGAILVLVVALAAGYIRVGGRPDLFEVVAVLAQIAAALFAAYAFKENLRDRIERDEPHVFFTDSSEDALMNIGKGPATNVHLTVADLSAATYGAGMLVPDGTEILSKGAAVAGDHVLVVGKDTTASTDRFHQSFHRRVAKELERVLGKGDWEVGVQFEFRAHLSYSDRGDSMQYREAFRVVGYARYERTAPSEYDIPAMRSMFGGFHDYIHLASYRITKLESIARSRNGKRIG
jgi:hypothetical protein